MLKAIPLPIASVLRVRELQGRVREDQDHIEEMEADLADKKKLEPVEVIEIDDPDDAEHHGKIYVWDGHHTHVAQESKGAKTIKCRKQVGTWQDARDLATGAANAKNKALKLSAADKRRRVHMAWEDRPDATVKSIAKHCKVSEWLAEDERKKVPAACTAEERVGKNGTIYKPKKKVAVVAEPEVPAAPKKKAKWDGHVHAEILKEIIRLNGLITRAMEGDPVLKRYLTDAKMVYAQDKIVDGRHIGFKFTGLRGVYRLVDWSGRRGMKGNLTAAGVMEVYLAALRGEDGFPTRRDDGEA